MQVGVLSYRYEGHAPGGEEVSLDRVAVALPRGEESDGEHEGEVRHDHQVVGPRYTYKLKIG